jgi:TP901 family phage tail tape measure protein
MSQSGSDSELRGKVVIDGVKAAADDLLRLDSAWTHAAKALSQTASTAQARASLIALRDATTELRTAQTAATQETQLLRMMQFEAAASTNTLRQEQIGQVAVTSQLRTAQAALAQETALLRSAQTGTATATASLRQEQAASVATTTAAKNALTQARTESVQYSLAVKQQAQAEKEAQAQVKAHAAGMKELGNTFKSLVGDAKSVASDIGKFGTAAAGAAHGALSLAGGVKDLAAHAATSAIGVANLGHAAEQASGGFTILKGVIASTIGSLSAQAISGGIAALKNAAGIGIKGAADLQQSVANISTIVDVNTQKLTADLNAMSGRVPETAAQLASSFYNIASSIDMASSGGQAGLTKITELLARGAVAASTDADTWGTAMLGLKNAYNQSFDQMQHSSDVMFKTIQYGVVNGQQLAAGLGELTSSAKVSGLSIDELGASIAAVTRQGGDAGQNLNNLNNLLTKFTTKSSQDELHNLGVKTLDAKGNFLPFMDVLTQTKARLDTMTPSARALELQAIFPDLQARTGLTTLLDQLDSAKTFLADNKTAAGTTEAAYTKMSQTASAQWKLFTNNLKAGAATVGASVLGAVTPQLVDFNKTLTDAQPKIQAFADRAGQDLNKLFGLVHRAAPGIGRDLSAAFVTAHDSVTTFEQAFDGKWTDANTIRPIHRAVGDLGLAFRVLDKDAHFAIGRMGLDLVKLSDQGHFGTATPMIREFGNAISNLAAGNTSQGLRELGATFKETGQLIDVAWQKVKPIAADALTIASNLNPLKLALDALHGAAVGGSDGALAAVATDLGKVKTAGVDLLGKIGDQFGLKGLKDILPGLNADLDKIGQGIDGGLKSLGDILKDPNVSKLPGALLDTAAALAQNLGPALKDAQPLISALAGALGGVLDFIKSNPKPVLEGVAAAFVAWKTAGLAKTAIDIGSTAVAMGKLVFQAGKLVVLKVADFFSGLGGGAKGAASEVENLASSLTKVGGGGVLPGLGGKLPGVAAAGAETEGAVAAGGATGSSLAAAAPLAIAAGAVLLTAAAVNFTMDTQTRLSDQINQKLQDQGKNAEGIAASKGQFDPLGNPIVTDADKQQEALNRLEEQGKVYARDVDAITAQVIAAKTKEANATAGMATKNLDTYQSLAVMDRDYSASVDGVRDTVVKAKSDVETAYIALASGVDVNTNKAIIAQAKLAYGADFVANATSDATKRTGAYVADLTDSVTRAGDVSSQRYQAMADSAKKSTNETGAAFAGVGEAAALVTAKVAQSATSAVDDFRSADWRGASKTASDNLATGFEGGTTVIVSKSQGAAAQAQGAFKGGDWFSIGSNMAAGIASGITANQGAIAAAAQNATANAVHSVKGYQQIASPSKRTHNEIGVPMGQGVGVGFVTGLKQSTIGVVQAIGATMSEAQQKAVSAVADLMSKVNSALTGGVSASAAVGTFVAPEASKTKGVGSWLSSVEAMFAGMAKGADPKTLTAIGTYADTLGKIVAPLSSAVSAINAIVTAKSVSAAQLANVFNPLLLMTQKARDVAKIVGDLTVAGAFGENLGKIIAPLKDAAAVLSSFTTFKGVSEQQIANITNPLILLAEKERDSAAIVGAAGAASGGVYGENLGKMVAPLKDAQTVLTGLLDLPTVSSDQIANLTNPLILLAEKERDSAKIVGDLTDAAAYGDAVNKMVAPLATVETVLTNLPTVPDVSGEMLNRVVQPVMALAQAMKAGAATIGTEGVAAAGALGDAVGKMTAGMSSALSLLTTLGSAQGTPGTSATYASGHSAAYHGGHIGRHMTSPGTPGQSFEDMLKAAAARVPALVSAVSDTIKAWNTGIGQMVSDMGGGNTKKGDVLLTAAATEAEQIGKVTGAIDSIAKAYIDIGAISDKGLDAGIAKSFLVVDKLIAATATIGQKFGAALGMSANASSTSLQFLSNAAATMGNTAAASRVLTGVSLPAPAPVAMPANVVPFPTNTAPASSGQRFNISLNVMPFPGNDKYLVVSRADLEAMIKQIAPQSASTTIATQTQNLQSFYGYGQYSGRAS